MVNDFMSVALEAAKKAEEVIMKYFSNNIDVKIKEDQTPVTIADTEAEKIIIETIKKNFPDHGFIGEESGEESDDSEYKWVIDPIDGTKNYMRGLPLFGTLIGLVKNEEVILGVSNIPALKELMHAEKGKGAFLNGKKVNVSSIDSLGKAYLGFGGLNHFEEHNHIQQLLSLIRNAFGRRGIGDCWNYHLVAQGKMDIMVEAKVNIWDIAPFKIIIEEAGGKITDMQGKPVGMDTKTIIATNGLLQDEVVGYFSKE